MRSDFSPGILLRRQKNPDCDSVFEIVSEFTSKSAPQAIYLMRIRGQ